MTEVVVQGRLSPDDVDAVRRLGYVDVVAIAASTVQGSAAGLPQANARWSQMKTPSQPLASAACATRRGTRASENVPMFARQIP